ncbi:MAG: hypothetical protein GY953_23370, partial [bacterium]|nr:hypothetical protein [bacterium]
MRVDVVSDDGADTGSEVVLAPVGVSAPLVAMDADPSRVRVSRKSEDESSSEVSAKKKAKVQKKPVQPKISYNTASAVGVLAPPPLVPDESEEIQMHMKFGLWLSASYHALRRYSDPLKKDPFTFGGSGLAVVGVPAPLVPMDADPSLVRASRKNEDESSSEIPAKKTTKVVKKVQKVQQKAACNTASAAGVPAPPPIPAHFQRTQMH